MLATDPNFTLDYLRSVVEYSPETGNFIWLVHDGCAPEWKTRYAGKIAGTINVHGYVNISKFGTYGHRLAWFYAHGEWPKCDIDHINGVRSDNRISNLRPCSRSENQQNRKLAQNNTSGFVGVCFFKPVKKWIAYIGIDGKRSYLGYFSSPEDARAAYLLAKSKLHQFQPVPRELIEGRDHGQ